MCFIPNQLLAGSRGLNIAFLDATTGDRSTASLRLAELFEKDIRELFLDPQIADFFPWSDQDLKLTELTGKASDIKFDRLLNTEDSQKIAATLGNAGIQDGLIVFFHDEANGMARLKLYDDSGKECLLLRLPLEGANSAMTKSLLKGHGRGVVVALGAAVRWSP